MSAMDDEFMDLGEIREFVRRLGPTATKRLLNEQTGIPIRMSQVVIQSVDWVSRQCTVKEFGDPTNKTNVAWLMPHVIPKPGQPFWMMKWANDAIIIGQASGVAFSTPFHGRTPGCVVYRTTGQSITNDTVVLLDWEAQRFDTDDMWEGVTNPDRITFNTPGLYIVGCNIQWPATSTGDVRRILSATKQGNTPGSADFDRDEQRYTLSPSIHVMGQRISRLYWTEGTGDYINFNVFHSATGALTLSVYNVNAQAAFPHAWAQYVGPEP